MARKNLVGSSFEELSMVFDMEKSLFESKKVRLFPSGNTDNEQATVSIFLATLSAVKEYREELFLKLGIKKIKTRNVCLHAYAEIQGGNEQNRPDGLLVITSGKSKPVIEWIGFVEAKIGEAKLEINQIESYAKYAKEIGIDDIITISNDLVTNPFMSPLNCKQQGRTFYHWSWSYLKVIAQRLINLDGIEDEDHIYILKEMRRYFDNHKRLKHFNDMGKDWKECASIIGDSNESNKKIKDDILDKIIPSIIQEEKDISLHLTDNTEYLIELITTDDRFVEIKNMIQENRKVISQYCIDGDKHCTFKIGIDFLRQEIRCSTQVIIDNGKAQSQTTTLIKMLSADAGYQDNIYINAIYPRNKCLEQDRVTLEVLSNERDNPKVNLYSILDKELGDTVKYFEIRTRNRIGRKFLGTKTFINDIEEVSKRFFLIK